LSISQQRVDLVGQLSNPGPRAIQRRLRAAEIDDLVTLYRAGRSLADLADNYGVHHRTVAAHLEQRGIQRRLNLPKMSEQDISDASRRYRAGDSLATVGKTHGVDAATVRRALVRAGVKIRPRRGF
jgi:lambda repressor-like predicted transcriptional regulator